MKKKNTNNNFSFLFYDIAVHNLSQVEVQQGFPLLLLKVISDESVDQTLRFAGAVYFKNYIKRHWVIVSFKLHFGQLRGFCRELF